MKLEMVKELSSTENPWYCIYLDGRYMMGSYDQKKIDEIFATAVKDPENFFKTKKEILKSYEFNVPL